MDAVVSGFDVNMIEVDGQLLQVGVRHGLKTRPPLLLFNGIGASWKMAKPFLDALQHGEAIIFDIPGVGGSPAPLLPYRPSTIASLSVRLVEKLGYDQIDVAGVSWGGVMAQQFAHQHPAVCRKVVLAATSPGALMIPGRPSVLWKLATPRRYFDKDFMRRIAPEIYGGDLRKDPELVAAYTTAGTTDLGYLYQLLAIAGWTSLPWLWSVKQPALVLSGSDDPIVPLINGHILTRLLPNARLEIVDDGHLFLLTRPKQTAAMIEKFLNE